MLKLNPGIIPVPEPLKVELKHLQVRNDRALESLLDEYLRSREEKVLTGETEDVSVVVEEEKI